MGMGYFLGLHIMNLPADAENADPKPGTVENGDTAELVVVLVN